MKNTRGFFQGLMSRFPVSVRILMLAMVPLLGLIALSSIGALQAYKAGQTATRLSQDLHAAESIAEVVHHLQVERGMTAGFLASGGKNFASELPAEHKKADAAITIFRTVFSEEVMSHLGVNAQKHVREGDTLVSGLEDQRSAILGLSASKESVVPKYTAAIKKLTIVVEDLAHAKGLDAATLRDIVALDLIMQAKERAGQERAAVTGGFTLGSFEVQDALMIEGLIARQEALFDKYIGIAEGEAPAHLRAALESNAAIKVQELREIALESVTSGDTRGVTGPEWFDASTKRINALYEIERETVEHLIASADLAKNNANASFIMGLIVSGSLILLTIVFSILVIWTHRAAR
jgi:hypothetical protein